MAITKERKDALIAQYNEWMSRSQAMIMTEYSGLSMKEMDALRAKVRDAGGEFHIIKNTLGLLSFGQAGMPQTEKFLSGSTAIAFAFSDAPAVAKAITDYAKTSQFLKVKGGYLNASPMEAESVKALAEMPPLPVMRAQLLGMLSAPASKLVRTLAEPGRSVAGVINAYAEHDAAAVAA